MHVGGRPTGSNLADVNLLGRKKDNTPSDDADAADARGGPQNDVKDAGTTAPKGRPTPKRNEAARKRGPIAPAPMTAAEARRRRKELGRPKLSREERKA